MTCEGCFLNVVLSCFCLCLFRKSSSKKKRSVSKSTTPNSKQNPDVSMNLDTLLGAAETSPLVELSGVKYRPSVGAHPEGTPEGIYPPSKRQSRSGKKSSSKNKRRETFVGGTEELERVIQSVDDSSNSLGDIVFESGGKKNTRRETCDAADMEAMLQDLDNDEGDESTTTSQARNLSVSALSEYEESPSAMASPYSNLLSMSGTSQSSRVDSSNHRSERFVDSSSLSDLIDEEEGDKISAKHTGNLKSNGKKKSRRLTVDSTDMADMLANLDDESTTSITEVSIISSKNRKPMNIRRQTCDAADMEDMLRALEEDDSDNESRHIVDQSVLEASVTISTPSSSFHVDENVGPFSARKMESTEATKQSARSPSKSSSVMNTSNLDAENLYCNEADTSTRSDVVFDSGGAKDSGGLTCDTADMEAMLQDLSGDDISTTSSVSAFSNNSRMDPKFRDIIVHDELNLTSSSTNVLCTSPKRSETPMELPMRRSPRLSRSAKKEDNSSKTKKNRQILTKSTDKSRSTRRDTFVGGAEAIEQMLVDVEAEDSTKDSRNKSAREDRRQTADAGDIEKIMRELEEEEAQAKNILGHRSTSTSSSCFEDDMSRTSTDCTPCPGSRESVDTVVLMNSVAALLEKVETDGTSSTAKTNLEFENEKTQTPITNGNKMTGSPSPLLNMSTGRTGSSGKQHSWQNLSVDDYTMNGRSFQSEDESHFETEGEDDISDDGTVNTVDLLSSVRNLVKNSEHSRAEQTSSSYQEVSIQSDLSDGTSFLSHDERRDSFDDNTVSTMGSLRSFFMENENDTEVLDTSTSSTSVKKNSRSPSRNTNPESLLTLTNPPSEATSNKNYQSPPGGEHTTASTSTTQGLKSCLSSRKKPRNQRVSLSSISDSAKKRGVVFGSPKAAEFNKTSPVTSYTPMHNHEAKSRFSMAGNSVYDDQEDDDEITTENSAILDEWDRLTNTSMDGSGSDEDISSPGSSGKQPVVVQRGGGRRATIGGAATSKSSVTSPSRNKKRRQSVQAALPILQNSASLRRNKRRKSRLHISDSDIQSPHVVDDDTSSCMDASGIDSSRDVSRTENLPGNLEELMQQPDLNPSPSVSTCSSIDSSSAPPLNSLVRSAALNASMSMASLNDSVTDRTQTLEQDLNALMSRVEKTGSKATVYQENDDSTVHEDIDSTEDEFSRRLSGSSMQSSVAGEGLGALLDCNDEADSGHDDETSARMRQIADSSSPTSSSDNSTVYHDQDQDVTVDSVVSFKKRSRKSSGSSSEASSVASASKKRIQSAIDVSNISASQEFTQELEMNLDTMMQTVIQNAVKQPSTIEETDDDVSMLTTSIMQPDQSYLHDNASEEDDDTILDEDAQIIEDDEGDGVITFNRRRRSSRGKSLIGEGECDISVISKSLDSIDDSRSTVPDDMDSSTDNLGLGISSSSLNMTCASNTAAETPNMLRKLRGLNAVSRRQSLSHAAHTPLAAAGRMSIGMKRMSLASQQLESTTKRISQRYDQRFTDTKTGEISSTGTPQQDACNISMISTASSVKGTSLNVSHGNTESYRDDMLQEFLAQLQLNDFSIAGEKTETLFDILTKFSESYTLQDSNLPLVKPDSQATFRSDVQSVFNEVLSAATEETAENSTLMEGDMINLWHCIEQSRYKTLVDALHIEGTNDSSSPIDQLRSMASRNMTISISKWQSWEVDLMRVALEAITTKKLVLREENQEMELDLEKISDENTVKRDEESIDVLEEKLAMMRNRLSEVRKEVSTKKEHLNNIQEQCSKVLTEKKNFLVALASDKTSVVKEIDIANDTSTVVEASTVDNDSKDKNHLDELKEYVAEMKFRLNILNKITYCRIITYKSDQIRVRVQLSKTVSLDIIFDLKFRMVPVISSEKNRRVSSAPSQQRSLCIDKVAVEPSFDTSASLGSYSDSETMLAVAFYRDFLTCDARNGPVSAKYLSSLNKVSELSQCLQQVSGHVSTLRDVMTWLGHMHLSPELVQTSQCSTTQAKWVWGIREAESGDFMVFLQHSSEVKVDIPLTALVAGDMELLPTQFFECRSPQSPGSISIQKNLRQLADRCSSPFGSFPIGQIMHAIAPH